MEDNLEQNEATEQPKQYIANTVGLASPVAPAFAKPAEPEEEQVPEHVYREAEVYKNAAATNIGSTAVGKPVVMDSTIEELINDTRSTEIEVRKRALMILSTREDVPIELRVKAARNMSDINSLEINLPYLITRNAEEFLATSDPEDEVRLPLVESRASLQGRRSDAAYANAGSAEKVVEINKLVDSGQHIAAFEYVLGTFQEEADLLSWDSLGLLLVPGEPQRGLEMARFLDNPKISAYIDKIGRGGGQIMYGTVLDNMGRILMNESPQEQLRVARAMLEYMKKKNPVGGSGNAWIELTVAEALLRPLISGEAYREGWDKVVPALNNLGGILDLAVIFKWAGSVLKVGGRSISEGLGLASRVAPKTVSKEMARYLQLSPDELAALGIKDGHDLLNVALPTHREVLRNSNMSAELAEQVKRTALGQLQTYKELTNALEVRPTNLSETQLTTGMTSFLNRKGLIPQTSLSTITAKGDDIEVTGRFGSAEGHGFGSADAAKAALVKSLGSEAVGTLAVRHIPSNTVLEEGDAAFATFSKRAASPKFANEYDWFVDVKTTTKYDEIYNVEDWVDSTVIGHDTGKVARALFDFNLTRSVDRLWDNSVTSTLMFHAGNKRHVQDMFQNLVKPELSKLSGKERATLNRVLFENAGKDTLFAQEDLAKMGLTSLRGQTAYYSVRGAMDIMYNVADKGLARSLRSENFRLLQDPSGARIGFGQEISIGEMAVKDSISVRLVDDAGARPVRMGIAELDKLRGEGASFYRMKFAEWIGNDEIAYTVVSKSQIPNAVKSIPANGVLPRAAGYFPEITRAPISIFGVSASGRKYVIATAETTKDATAYIAKARLDADLSKRYTNFGSEYFSGYKDAVSSAGREHEIYENLQGVVYGHKSAGDIVNASGIGADYNKLDPLNAMQSVFMLLSNNYTKGSYIQYMESQLTKFAKQFNLVSADALQSGRKVTAYEDLIPGTKLMGEQARLLKQARQWIDTIDAYKLTPDAVQEFSAGMWKKFAALTAKSIPSLERYFLKNAQDAGDILARINGVFHFTNIVTNPIRQFMMNSAQALTNLAHPYAFSKAFFRHKTGFATALFLKKDAAAGLLKSSDLSAALNKTAKGMGVSRAELDGMVDAYLQGGVWNQVSHNTVARASAITEAEAAVIRDVNRNIDPNVVQEGLERVKGLFSTSKDVLNQAGFAVGEHENAMYTFLTLFNAHRGDKAFDVTTDAGRKALSGKTMAWIGNMTPEGRTGFQKGWWKTMFQYVAFQYKMLMNVMPTAFGGSKMLTGPEKAKIALSQALLFGTDAVFIGSKARQSFEKYFIYDKNLTQEEMMRRKELYDQVNLAFDFQYGIAGRSLNTMAQAVNNNMRDPEDWDTSPDVLNFGEILGIGTGTELIKERAFALADSIGSLSSGDYSDAWKNALIIVGGTNGKKLNDWYQFAEISTKLLGKMPVTYTPEQRMQIYKFVAQGTANRAFGMLDKYQILRAERYYNEQMSKTGVTYAPYNDNLRNQIGTLFGITWATEEEYYANRDKKVTIIEDKLEAPTNERKQMINSNARNLYKYLLEMARTIPQDADENFVNNVQLTVQNNMEAMRAVIPEKDYYETVEALKALMARDMEAKNSNAEWLDRLHGTVVNAQYGDEGFDQVIKVWAMETSRVYPWLGNAAEEWVKQNKEMQFIFEEEEK